MTTDPTQPRTPAFLERAWIVLAVCLAVSFITYASALGNKFFNDDSTFLNDARQHLHEPLKVFTISPLGWYRPLWSFYIWVLYRVFELNPLPYFIIGIAIHGLTGFLVWRLARAIRLSAGACWVAALAFITFFSHCESTLWMAAHNSSMVATMAILAMLANLSAAESGGARILIAPLLVLAALFTKETGVTAVAWVPLAELLCINWRKLSNRKALVRYALIALVRYALIALAVWFFFHENPRMSEAASGANGAGDNARANIKNITLPRILGAFVFLFSPVGCVGEGAGTKGDMSVWAGAAAVAGLFIILIIFRRDLILHGLFAAALAFVALAPTSTTMLQMGTPYRLYYFATVGAALCLALLYECSGPRPARAAASMILLFYFCWNAWSLRTMNLKYYQPFSVAQTSFTIKLAEHLPPNRPARLILTEPPITNLFHLQRFLELYYGIPESQIERHLEAADTAPVWLQREIKAGSTALRYENGEFAETSVFPPHFDISFTDAQGREHGPEPVYQMTAYKLRWIPYR
ncbi:MAG: hypothetical protein HY286_05200 [Planctomycetes bacterium]|nr:hypothetical protein [Planctomycetota bacterium]